MGRFVLDTSTSQSSTAMNIRKFIKDTELSDHKINRDTSTLPSTTFESNKDLQEKHLIHESREPSFHFINKSLMDQINKPDQEDQTGSLDQIETRKLALNEGSNVPNEKSFKDYKQHNEGKNENGPNSYQNKLKYLQNADFKYENNDSYSMNSMNSPVSIPNTFKYKSHPNAKTKSTLGIPHVDTLLETEEQSMNISSKSKDASRSDSTPPVKTSTIKEKQDHGMDNTDFNSTPEWMPDELADKWVPPKSLELENLEILEPKDFGSSVRISKRNKPNWDLDMNLQLSTTNTMIHNSNTATNETPMWKKASKEYEFNKKSQPQLHNIFLSMDNLKEDEANEVKSAHNTHIQLERERESESNNNSVSSTLSTPMASISYKSGAAHLTKHQIIQLENILEEEGKGKPNDYLLHVPNPESPLKLFGDKYNTFTKGKLTDLLQKINTKTPTSAQLQKSEKQKTYDNVTPRDSNPLQEPHLRIKSFTKSGTYTEEQFLQNANNIFNNIQKRGFKMNQDVTNEMDQVTGRQRSLSSAVNSQTTATSTPKNSKRNNIEHLPSDDEYSSFTSRFEEQESTEFPQYNTDDGHNDNQQNEYTSFDRSNPSSGEEGINHPQLSPRNLRNLQRELNHSNESSYTIDEGESGNNATQVLYDDSSQNNVDHDKMDMAYFANKLKELEKMMENLNLSANQTDIKKLRDENTRLKEELENQNHKRNENGCEIVVDDANFTQEDISQMQNFIKWKRASQLRLQNNNSLNGSPSRKLKEPPIDQHPIVKGRVEPGIELPVAYSNMILDAKNQRWIENDKENQYQGSLDSIEDLLIRSDEEVGFNNFEAENMKNGKSKKSKKSKKRLNDSKLEVSFNLPSIGDETDEQEQEDRSSALNNITHVSQINDMTFSQTQKKLVAVITDLLSTREGFKPTDWEKVTEISMCGCQLESIMDLNKFVPRLKKVDLSDNNIKYLDGLPIKVFSLNLSNNNIEHLTSFSQYHDLLHLNLSFNKMTNLSNVNNNIHLTELIVSNSQLVSLDGIRYLENLTKLDISQNDLMGEINFSNFNLVNLQELNVSENSIQSLLSLECLPSMRILNANENQISQISCIGKHVHLKKLLLKLNCLKRLNLEPYPFLRCLRIDGNNFNVVTDFKKLKYLEELSCKSQNSSDIVIGMLNGASDITKLDISGNYHLNLFNSSTVELNQVYHKPFLNLNRLVLSAMNLTKLPNDFADLFPNVRELNLNFNNLSNIASLSKMHNISRLYLVSNNIKEIECVVESLKAVRSTLKVLDLRLNPINLSVYPYVFNPEELEYSTRQLMNTADGAPIQLETLDDIESFAIHYQSLIRDHEEWTERDTKFFARLKSDANLDKARHRLNYETLLIKFFNHLKILDGSIITYGKRRSYGTLKDNSRLSTA